MTREEINKFLEDTKVYVAGKSEEIQKKLFSFGYKWAAGETEVDCTGAPFLYISKNHCITKGRDMCIFTEHGYREISADEILSLKITESDYRPFKNKEECWKEMLKHEPFGWVKSKDSGSPMLIGNIYLNIDEEVYIVRAYNGTVYSASDAFYNFTFADGTPFGIKEE